MSIRPKGCYYGPESAHLWGPQRADRDFAEQRPH